jgi:hypothetical protein
MPVALPEGEGRGSLAGPGRIGDAEQAGTGDRRELAEEPLRDGSLVGFDRSHAGQEAGAPVGRLPGERTEVVDGRHQSRQGFV